MTSTAQRLLSASAAFFSQTDNPTTNNLIRSLVERSQNPQQTFSQIVQFAQDTRILVHSRVIPALDAFLSHKRTHGTSREKSFYSSVTRTAFIQRLIKNRPLTFFTHFDRTLLRDGTVPPAADWERVGQDKEGKIKLESYLSYDEMELAALLGVSSPTYFINDGDRDNVARIGKSGTFEETGVYVGLVGARFERSEKMDSKHILISEKASTPENGYGPDGKHQNPKSYSSLQPFAELYLSQPHFPTYTSASSTLSPKTYEPLPTRSPFTPSAIFNIPAYKSRIRIPLELLLFDANDRARLSSRKAFVHIVGLGLGVWRKSPTQYTYYLEALSKILTSLPFPHISDIELAYFPDDSPPVAGAAHGQSIKSPIAENRKIRIHFTTRNPAAKLPTSDDGTERLLVASYAWDGNSFPGNEYWMGMVSASGDPAAVCCSLVGELQNGWVNEGLLERIWVCGGEGEGFLEMEDVGRGEAGGGIGSEEDTDVDGEEDK
ncbi:hypothetical protein HK097_010215 [Rhizophlyctis rosea]|uniref:Uncharacterized protein n=1 Tax=Rhizophlyctis rosea TaxID=64517 RepID=A0AAD5SIA2_9FUNG|nr:hypothetical protein HK097_010215 [Rhizophlyctis rosea]